MIATEFYVFAAASPFKYDNLSKATSFEPLGVANPSSNNEQPQSLHFFSARFQVLLHILKAPCPPIGPPFPIMPNATIFRKGFVVTVGSAIPGTHFTITASKIGHIAVQQYERYISSSPALESSRHPTGNKTDFSLLDKVSIPNHHPPAIVHSPSTQNFAVESEIKTIIRIQIPRFIRVPETPVLPVRIPLRLRFRNAQDSPIRKSRGWIWR